MYYVTGGVLFFVLCCFRSEKNPGGLALSDMELLRALSRALDFVPPDSGRYDDTYYSFKTAVSELKMCRTSRSRYHPFGSRDAHSDYLKLLSRDYPTALAAMEYFVQNYLDSFSLSSLNNVLLRLISEDAGADDAIDFITGDGEKSSADSLLSSDLPLPRLLIALCCFVLPRKNSDGADTFSRISVKTEDGHYVLNPSLAAPFSPPRPAVPPALRARARELESVFSTVKTLVFLSRPVPFKNLYVPLDLSPPFESVIRPFYLAGHVDILDYEKIPGCEVSPSRLMEESSRVIIEGRGGMGKTMLARSLYLNALSSLAEGRSSRIPLLINLRRLSIFRRKKKSAFNALVSGALRESFPRELPKDPSLLLILDGLDETSLKDYNKTVSDISSWCFEHPSAQCVILSRKTGSFAEFSSFTVLDMCPLTCEQAARLVKNLSGDDDCPFLQSLDTYFDTMREYAENPLLLSLMFLVARSNGWVLPDVSTGGALFYEQAYRLLLREHDAAKPLNREFRSGLTPEEFSNVLFELSAKMYFNFKYSFSYNDLKRGGFFNNLSSVQSLKSAGKTQLTLKSFMEDAVSSVPIMYYDGKLFSYLHRSFQEYFFAAYYNSVSPSEFQAMCREINDNMYDHTRDMGGLRMLHAVCPERLSASLLPLLFRDPRFKGERGFLFFLAECVADGRFTSFHRLYTLFYPPVWYGFAEPALPENIQKWDFNRLYENPEQNPEIISALYESPAYKYFTIAMLLAFPKSPAA